MLDRADYAAFLKETKLEADPEDHRLQSSSFWRRRRECRKGYQDRGCFRRALPKKTLGDAEWLDKNAEHHLEEGRFRDAERLYLDSLSIRVYLFGGEHPEAAVGYNNLGELLSCFAEVRER